MATTRPAPEPDPVFDVSSELWHIASDAHLQFIDITERVAERVRRSGVQHGIVSIQTRHTTTAVIVNENEPLLLEDMKDLLERLAPRGGHYRHHDFESRQVPPEESPNGHSHCQAMLLGASESLSIVAGQIQLGTWQRIFLVELDGPRPRTVSVTVLGAR
jgi:secondary thiamine-phosphate synthase enzyme